MISSISSNPTDNLIKPGVIPILFLMFFLVSEGERHKKGEPE